MDAPDDDGEVDDIIEHEAELNAYLVGLVVKVREDDEPGVVLHYSDGRVLRLIATSQFVGVVPVSPGKVH